MRPGRPWWGRWVLQGVVEAVDLLLELGDGVGQGLLVQVAEQGLVEALVLALGGGVVGFAGDGFDAQGAHVLHQAAGDSAPAGVEGRAVVGQQALGHSPGGHAPVEDVDGRLTGLARGDQPGHRQAPMVVLEPARSPPCARRPGRTRWRRAARGVVGKTEDSFLRK